MIAIYKITSPNKSVYIGQSIDIKRRFRHYIKYSCKSQERLHNSFNKYGVLNHSFDILHEFPNDIDIKVVNEYEFVYWSFYLQAGFNMMNLRVPGDNKNLTIEHRKKIGDSLRGKKRPTVGDKVRKALLGIKLSDKRKENISKGKIGKPNPHSKINSPQCQKNKIVSEETKKKMSETKKGKPIPWLNNNVVRRPPWNKGVTGYTTKWKGMKAKKTLNKKQC